MVEFGRQCKQHNNKQTLFCINDQAFFCNDCIALNHTAHSYLEGQQVINFAMISAQTELCNDQKACIRTLKDELFKTIEQLETEISNLDANMTHKKQLKVLQSTELSKLLEGIPNHLIESQRQEQANNFQQQLNSLENEFLQQENSNLIEILRKYETKLKKIINPTEGKPGIVHFAEKGTNLLYIFDPSEEKVINRLAISNGKFIHYCETAAIGSRIFCFGGYDGSQQRKDVKEVDLVKEEFIPKCEMTESKYQFGINSYKNEIFVIGGQNELNGQISNCETYDIFADKWSSLKEFEKPIELAGSAILSENLFVIGGNSCNEQLSTIQKIDLQSRKSWEIVSMKKNFDGSFGMLSIPLNGSTVLVVGGQSAKGQLDRTLFLMFYEDGRSCFAEEGEKMPVKEMFRHTSTPFICEEKVFIFTQKGDLLIFQINTKNWKLIKKDDWL